MKSFVVFSIVLFSLASQAFADPSRSGLYRCQKNQPDGFVTPDGIAFIELDEASRLLKFSGKRYDRNRGFIDFYVEGFYTVYKTAEILSYDLIAADGTFGTEAFGIFWSIEYPEAAPMGYRGKTHDFSKCVIQ
jgi:hypothetical protein